MWWHTSRNQISSFRRNGRVNLNRLWASVQSTTGSRGVRISGSNAGYTMFRGSVKGTGYPYHSPVCPQFPLHFPSRASPCVITFQLESTTGTRGQLKCDGTRQKPDFVFRRSRRVHLNWQGASVQSTTGSWGVRISGSNAGYTMFRGSVKSTGYPLHSPVSPSLPFPVRHRVPSHFNWSLLLVLEASWNVMAHARNQISSFGEADESI